MNQRHMELSQNVIHNRDNQKVSNGQEIVVKPVKSDLKKNLTEGKIIKINETSGNIIIPPGKFNAPNEIFAETDESFKEIVTRNLEKIKELNQIEDMDAFIRHAFEFIKGEMGLNPNIKLEITENDNHYDVKENTVYISKNWAGHKLKHVNGKGDKAEIFGGLVHEFNHYLQRKEFILNFDQDSQYRVWIINYLQKYPPANENIEYILNHYQDNLELQEVFEKAKVYGKGRENYINPKIDENQKVINYNEYKGQPVEAESFRRGDIVVEAYRNAVMMPKKS